MCISRNLPKESVDTNMDGKGSHYETIVSQVENRQLSFPDSSGEAYNFILPSRYTFVRLRWRHEVKWSHSVVPNSLQPHELQQARLPCPSLLLLGRKAMTNLESVLKSRDIILPTKVCIVKAIVMYTSHIQMWVGPKEGVP